MKTLLSKMACVILLTSELILLVLVPFFLGGCHAIGLASSSALENEHLYNPCKFNPLCLCSTGGMYYRNSKTRWDNIIVALQIFMIQHYCTFYTLAAEYGSVVCDGVPMADIPAELQDSRVFKLHLRSNSLHRFPDSKLEGTGKLK